jgi:hypothetical protein
MNLSLKFLFSIGLLSLVCLMLSASLPAETIYTYSGNTFTACTNVFVDQSTDTCQGAVDLSFETSLIGSQLYNLSNFDIAGPDTLLSFSADDGPGDVGGSIGCGFGCMTPTLATVQISTNAVGPCASVASVSGEPGTWTIGVVKPLLARNRLLGIAEM